MAAEAILAKSTSISTYNPEQLADSLQALSMEVTIFNSSECKIGPIDDRNNSYLHGKIFTVIYDRVESELPSLCSPNFKWLDRIQEGDVIVLVNRADNSHKYCVFGEILALESQRKKAQGFVTNSNIRDVTAIREMNFPVFCVGYSCQNSSKYKVVGIQETITRADFTHNPEDSKFTFRPGDYFAGNASGFVIIPHNQIDDVYREAAKKKIRETHVKQLLQIGVSLSDAHQMATGRICHVSH